FARVVIAPAAVVKSGAAFAARRLAHLLELLGAGIAAGTASGRPARVRHFAVPLRLRKLVDGVAVPFDAKPVKPIEDGIDGGLGGALAIGILDAQQHFSATAARVKPIEQSGARPADMQEA